MFHENIIRTGVTKGRFVLREDWDAGYTQKERDCLGRGRSWPYVWMVKATQHTGAIAIPGKEEFSKPAPLHTICCRQWHWVSMALLGNIAGGAEGESRPDTLQLRVGDPSVCFILELNTSYHSPCAVKKPSQANECSKHLPVLSTT